MDIEQQIKYWVDSGQEDFAAAQSLCEKGYCRHSLFFAHLSIEKMLKAHVVKETQEVPPKIHDLTRLGKIAKLKFNLAQEDMLLEFGLYQMEGRYPDSQQIIFTKHFVENELGRAKEILEWLKAKLPV